MEFDFEKEMNLANSLISEAFSKDFNLTLNDNSVMSIPAIFDTKILSNNSSQDNPIKMMKHGCLTVCGMRLDKKLLMSAITNTPIGQRVVIDVDYDDTDTIITLGMPKGVIRGNEKEGF